MTGFPSPSTLHYEGAYKGRPISGEIPVWSIPNSPVDAARRLDGCGLRYGARVKRVHVLSP